MSEALHPEAAPVWGVLLAAGRGTRMGQPKPLVPLWGRPLIAHAAQALAEGGLDGLLVVTPPGDLGREIRAVLGPDWQAAENPDPARGLASSFRVAGAALPVGVGAVFALADMPFVPASAYRAMRGAFAVGGCAVVQAVYGQEAVPAPPLLLRSDLIAALASVPDADQGPRELLRRAAAQTRQVRLSASALVDIDTPQALAEVQAQTAADPQAP